MTAMSCIVFPSSPRLTFVFSLPFLKRTLLWLSITARNDCSSSESVTGSKTRQKWRGKIVIHKQTVRCLRVHYHCRIGGNRCHRVDCLLPCLLLIGISSWRSDCSENPLNKASKKKEIKRQIKFLITVPLTSGPVSFSIGPHPIVQY